MSSSRTSWPAKLHLNPPDSQFIERDSGAIHTLSWGKNQPSRLVCLHGASANAYWFAPLGVSLSDRHHIVAISLPGHGQSSWQDHYTLDDLLSIIEYVIDQDSDKPTMLVGHSFGGRLVLEYLRRRPNALQGACVLDPPGMRLPGSFASPAIPRTHTVRAAKAALLDRFRIIPSQPLIHPDLCRYVAEHSIVAVPGGWRWQFDPNFFFRLDGDQFLTPTAKPIDKLSTPLEMIFGSHTTVCTEPVRKTLQQVFPSLHAYELEDAWHALTLDQPLLLADHIALLGTRWL